MVGKYSASFLLAILLFTAVYTSAQTKISEVENLVVKAEAGDGIFKILRRYELHQNASNLDTFLSMNKLSPTDFLSLGKKYTLPIRIYDFDGKTIRSTLNIDDYEQALRIQKYNETLVKSGAKPISFREDEKLWVPYHEFFGVVPTSGFKSYTMKSPIMGADYEEITVVDETLKGCVYYLVSGHGGPDPGAMTHKDGKPLCEDEYAYDVTLRLARNLLSHSAKVYMIIRDPDDGIRDEAYLGYDRDERCWENERIPANHRARLKQRVDAVNSLYAINSDAKLQKMICIHVDSRTEGEKIDIFFYHFPGSTTGEESANTLLTTIDAKYNEHQKNRGYKGIVKGRDLYVLRESKPSAVYIELGNITNDFDQKRLLIVDNRQAIANWLTLGIQTDAVNMLGKK